MSDVHTPRLVAYIYTLYWNRPLADIDLSTGRPSTILEYRQVVDKLTTKWLRPENLNLTTLYLYSSVAVKNATL